MSTRKPKVVVIEEAPARPVGPVVNWVALGRLDHLRRGALNLQIVLGEALAAALDLEAVLRDPGDAEADGATMDEAMVNGHEAMITLAAQAGQLADLWCALDEALEEKSGK